MKKCPGCGLMQDDGRQTCVDCGKVLGAPVGEEEEYQAQKAAREKIDDAYRRTADFTLTLADKLMLAGCAAGLVGGVVMLVLRSQYSHAAFGVYGAFILAIVVFSTLFPRLGWKLEVLRARRYFDVDENAVPYSYVLGWRIARWIGFAVGIFLILYFIIDPGYIAVGPGNLPMTFDDIGEPSIAYETMIIGS